MILRRVHRVVGYLSGPMPSLPAQVGVQGPPLVLSPEEVHLLVRQERVARMVMMGELQCKAA